MRIYLAGAETWNHILEVADYPHRLGTIAYVDGGGTRLIGMNQSRANWLLDSGIFTLIQKGERPTLEEAREYCRLYLDRVRDWKHPIVECDMQTVLGIEETWNLREEFFEGCGREVMYVWHWPDGEEGLERMAKRYGFIGISVPELKHHFPQTFHKAVFAATSRIRAVNPKVKIHLLGTSDPKLLALPAASCDVTNWIGAMQFGTGLVYDPSKPVRLTPVSIRSPRWRAWVTHLRRLHPDAFERIEKLVASESSGVYLPNLLANALTIKLVTD